MQVILAADSSSSVEAEFEDDKMESYASADDEGDASVSAVAEEPAETPAETPQETPQETPAEPPTETPTEPPTEAPTETPTEPTTEAPTEAPTESESESETAAPTESETAAPTEGTTEASSSGTEGSTEGSTETNTAPATETASEKQSESASETDTSKTTETAESKKTEKETEKDKDKIEATAAENYKKITGEDIYAFGQYPTGNITENTNEIYDYLRKEMGLNHAAACGVLANIQCESNFCSTAIGDGGTSYGLCQWHLGRFSALIDFCNANGTDYHSIEGQLGYLECELNNGYVAVLNYIRSVPDTAEGAYQAAYFWCKFFEIPSNIEYNSVMRANLAMHEFYPKTLGNPEKEKKKKAKAVLSDAEMDQVIEDAPSHIVNLARLDTTKEKTVEKSVETTKINKTIDWETFDSITEQAIDQALEEYNAREAKKEQEEDTFPEASEITANLAKLGVEVY